MSQRLDRFARELDGDEAFLAAALAAYARSEELDEQGLAAELGCAVDTLTRLRLCLRPRPDCFDADVQEIATTFGADAEVLTRVVRRADVLARLRAASVGAQGLLMAARDRESPPTAPEREAPP